jgi:hypothetical protein
VMQGRLPATACADHPRAATSQQRDAMLAALERP